MSIIRTVRLAWIHLYVTDSLTSCADMFTACSLDLALTFLKGVAYVPKGGFHGTPSVPLWMGTPKKKIKLNMRVYNRADDRSEAGLATSCCLNDRWETADDKRFVNLFGLDRFSYQCCGRDRQACQPLLYRGSLRCYNQSPSTGSEWTHDRDTDKLECACYSVNWKPISLSFYVHTHTHWPSTR